tara:strand:+ start:4594 stop:6228 length:1635 start_codon:yes stop_codon:yes gene_type:complete
MKVPTYTSQTAIPTRGQGQFVTAQLSTSAMTAPALAAAEAGAMLKQSGKKISALGNAGADFAIKKIQIADEAKATAAANDYELAINESSEAALKIADTNQAEIQFNRDLKLIEGVQRSKLTSTRQKQSFQNKVAERRLRATLDFRKQNNKRVVDQRKATLNQTEEFAIRAGSDITKSVAVRNQSLAEGIAQITAAGVDIGFDEVQERLESLTKSTIASTLANMTNTENADALRIISDFRAGNSPDPIIQSAQKLLTPEQLNKIADDALKGANRVIKARKNAREEADRQSNVANDEIYNKAINADFNDPAQRQLAEDAHKLLLESGYYETPAKRNAIEGLLYPEKAGGKFVETEESRELEASLEELESLDQLTYEVLIEARGRVSSGFYSKMLQQLEGDRNDAEKEGIQLFKDAFDFVEQSDSKRLKTPSRMAFRKASIQFRTWVSKKENRTKTPDEILEKSRSIVKDMQVQFAEAQRKFRQAELQAAHSQLQGVYKGAVPDPSSNSIEEVKAGLTRLLVKYPNDAKLLGLLNLINEEFTLQVFE